MELFSTIIPFVASFLNERDVRVTNILSRDINNGHSGEERMTLDSSKIFIFCAYFSICMEYFLYFC